MAAQNRPAKGVDIGANPPASPATAGSFTEVATGGAKGVAIVDVTVKNPEDLGGAPIPTAHNLTPGPGTPGSASAHKIP